MSTLWSKVDERGLARLVSPETARRVRLAPGAASLLGVRDRRRELVEAIYRAFVDADVTYAPERYHPEAAQQEVRSAHEVLDAPGIGTCLDLAVHFCGVCLAYELLPILIVTEGHALAAVSMRHGLREWTAYDRSELALFERAPLTDGEQLRSLVASDVYVAVECTGFARAASLPGSVPEGRGRTDGLLPFARAVQAGAEQLSLTERPLRFALDIVVAHQGWMIAPPRLEGAHEVAIEGIVANLLPDEGMFARRVAKVHRVRHLPRPVAPRLRATLPLLDRTEALAVAAHALEPSRPVAFSGRPGVGRTALLEAILRDRATSLLDGATIVSGRQRGVRDVLQETFDAFFEDPAGTQRSEAWLARNLAPLQATIAVDDLDLSADEVGAVLTALPEAHVLVASEQPVALATGRGHAVGGLPLEDAVKLLSQVIGRSLEPDEQGAAEQLWKRVEGHPGDLILAATRVRDERVGLMDLAARTTRPNDVGVGLYEALDPSARAVVRVLLAFRSGALSSDHLQVLAPDGDADAGLRELLARGLVESHSPRYTLAPALARALEGRVAPVGPERVVERFVSWTADFRTRPDALADDVDVLPGVVELATALGDDRAVMQLARATDVVLPAAGRLDAWRAVLRRAGESALRLNDLAVQGWALHQEGSLDLGLGDVDMARRRLTQALEIRRHLHDEAGIGATQNNLDLLPPPTPADGGDGDQGPDEPQPEGEQPRPPTPPSRRWPRWLGTLVTLGAAIGALLLLLDGEENNGLQTDPVTVQPEELDFGAVVVDGEPGTRSVVVTNPTDGPSRVATSIDGDAAFQVTENCPETLETGRQCIIALIFSPTSERSYNGTLQVTVTESTDTRDVDVALSGEGVPDGQAAALLDPGTVDFGEVQLEAFPTLAVGLSNVGGAPMTVTAVIDPSEPFFLEFENCTGTTLAPGETCAIEVGVGPQEAKPIEGRLVVEFDEIAPAEAALIATGVAPFLTADPQRLQVPSEGDPAILTLTNEGRAPLVLGDSFVEPDDGSFAFPVVCPDELPPAESCRVEVTTQAPPGTAALLTILSNSEDGDVKVELVSVSLSPPRVLEPEQDGSETSGYAILDDGRLRIQVVFDSPIEQASVVPQGNVRLSGDAQQNVPIAITFRSPTVMIVTSEEDVGAFVNFSPDGGFALELDGEGQQPMLGMNLLALDGDEDGAAGGLYRRRFVIIG